MKQVKKALLLTMLLSIFISCSPSANDDDSSSDGLYDLPECVGENPVSISIQGGFWWNNIEYGYYDLDKNEGYWEFELKRLFDFAPSYIIHFDENRQIDSILIDSCVLNFNYSYRATSENEGYLYLLPYEIVVDVRKDGSQLKITTENIRNYSIPDYYGLNFKNSLNKIFIYSYEINRNEKEEVNGHVNYEINYKRVVQDDINTAKLYNIPIERVYDFTDGFNILNQYVEDKEHDVEAYFVNLQKFIINEYTFYSNNYMVEPNGDNEIVITFDKFADAIYLQNFIHDYELKDIEENSFFGTHTTSIFDQYNCLPTVKMYLSYSDIEEYEKYINDTEKCKGYKSKVNIHSIEIDADMLDLPDFDDIKAYVNKLKNINLSCDLDVTL